jgi:signal transduction histidine kinase/Na+/proline symporter/CheY-like chemotaxis protein
MLVPIFNVVAKLFIGLYVAPRMKQFKGAISVGDIMGNLYGREAKVITGVAGMFLSMGYIGAQIAGTGYVLNNFFGIDTNLGIMIGAGIVIIYSAFGGIRSVTATDVLQFAAIVVVIPIMATIAVGKAGGYPAILENIAPEKLIIFVPGLDKYELIFTLLVFIVPFLNPAIVQRLLLAKDSNDVARSFKIAGILDIAFYFLVGSIGLSAFMLAPDIDPNNAFFYIIENTLPIGIKGIAIVGLLAVIMSTADSYLNVASISLIHDTIKPLKPDLSDKTALLLSKIASVVFGIGGIAMATSHSNIIDIAHAALDFWGPIVVMPLLLGILGFRGSKRTFYSSVAVGVLTYLILKNITSPNVLGISRALLPSMLANAATFLFMYYMFDKKAGASDPNSGGRQEPMAINDGESASFAFGIKEKVSTLSWEAITGFSKYRVSVYGAQYIAFGVFGLVSYSMPFFMWQQPTEGSETFIVLLRFTASLLCFFLVVKDYWPSKLKQYLPGYWHFTLAFCIPFFATIMMLTHGINTIWLVNMALGLFLLSVLLDWVSFVVVLGFGVAVALLGFSSLYDLNNPVPPYSISVSIYIALFSVLIGAIFSRNREFIQKQVVDLLESKVSERTSELTRALAIRKEVMNNMSHEIRTPIHGVINLSQEVVDQWDRLSTKDKKMYIQKVADSGNRLMSLVSNLLDLSKAEAGKMTLSCKKRDLGKVVRDVVKEFDPLRKGYIKVKIPAKLDSVAEFDIVRMSQVIRNLISNAMKYGKQDIKISLSKTKDKQLLFVISDRGIGIPKDQLRAIFLPFEQSTATKTRAGGTGLGLAICKDMIEAHNGQIWAENNEGGGAVFKFTIPYSVNEDAAEHPVKLAKKSLNVLIIDDEEITRASSSLIVESMGHKAVTMDGGTSALEYLNNGGSKKIDLIMLDLMMPDMYGLSVLEHLKGSRKLQDIPVVLQTGSEDQNEINKAYKLGIIGHMC